MAIDDGGAAYPCPVNVEHPKWSDETLVIESTDGMTLLDHFAETMWRPSEDMADIKDITGSISREVAEGCERKSARQAYAYAKAMIKEKRRLEKENTDGN